MNGLNEAHWWQHTRPGLGFVVIAKPNKDGVAHEYRHFILDGSAEMWTRDRKDDGWTLVHSWTVADVNAFHASLID